MSEGEKKDEKKHVCFILPTATDAIIIWWLEKKGKEAKEKVTEMDVTQWIKDTVRCCACGGSLQNSKHVNIVCLDNWPLGNIRVGETSWSWISIP